MECPRCNMDMEPRIIIHDGKDEFGNPTIHYGRRVCPYCHKWLGWVPKPKNKATRSKTSKYSLDDLGIHYCEICLRTPEMLGRFETLHIHHKMPVELGGADEKSNLLAVCTYCHESIHLRHKYLYEHFKPKSVDEAVY